MHDDLRLGLSRRERQSAAGCLVVDPGDRCPVPVLNDATAEPHEVLYGNLWNPVNAVIAKGTAACVVRDNDHPPMMAP